ncbi:MAG: hypothetical protein K2K91_00225 [Ruminococcus sp.]|nr:hypothetical protein [Ruminococcus sp.]
MQNDIKKLRNKYKKHGYKSLTDREKIEFILSYSEKNAECIKKATEKILNTHNIINGEMKTDIFFAMNEFGISMESAVLLNLILKITKICSLNKLKIHSDNFKKIKLNSIDNSKKFFNAFFHNSYTEELIVVAVNENLEIINHKKIISSESDMIEVSHKKIYHFAKANNSERIFFAHCHPYGSSKPSQRDIDTTLKIKHTLNLLNIKLVDHIVVGKDDATSICEILKTNAEY